MIHPNFEKLYGKDTKTIWHFIWPAILVFGVFVLSIAFVTPFTEWLDKTFDKSDQQKTGVVLLFLFSLSFGVLCITNVFRRRF